MKVVHSVSDIGAFLRGYGKRLLFVSAVISNLLASTLALAGNNWGIMASNPRKFSHLVGRKF
jgi:hypothetical protein